MTAAPVPPHIPARMLNEYAYCPRLAYLMWVQQEWEESADTIEGRHVHRRVERGSESLAQIHHRSVQLASDRLGLTAVIDLLESASGAVRPVGYKRGKKPAIPEGAYEPERVQLCAQGLLLREHGLRCDEGILFFAASKQRVRVRFTPKLIARTLELLAEMRQQMASGTLPPPLEDSPKCPRCSLVGICLPDEVNFLRRGGKVRRLAVLDPATFPLVVQEPGARVRLDHERFLVEASGRRLAAQRIAETSHLVLMGGSHCSGPVLRECCQRGLLIAHLSGTGWFYGITHGMVHKNVELRWRQFAAAEDGERSLAIARQLVAAKIANSRVLLRRNGRASVRELQLLTSFARLAASAPDSEALLGIEGNAARLYFSRFGTMLKGQAALAEAFQFNERNKRPPRDPVNALLSFAYALLTKDWTIALYTVGFDPLMGLYHRPRYGKPALALDMMEPFRPVIADSVVVGCLNNGEIMAGDFQSALGGVLLKPAARRRLAAAYERRLALEVRHPIFGYRCTYRRIFELEARLLARHLLGETAAFRAFSIR